MPSMEELNLNQNLRWRQARVFSCKKRCIIVVLDEFASMDPDTWPVVVRPMLADRRGRALFIGTPRSYDHFYDLYMAAKLKEENWARFHCRTDEGGYVMADELATVKAEIDPK